MSMTCKTAARHLARGCANHTRIVLLALNADREVAVNALLDRMNSDMTDALTDTPERDDYRAQAGRVLNACPGPMMRAEMREQAERTIRNIRLLNRR